MPLVSDRIFYVNNYPRARREVESPHTSYSSWLNQVELWLTKIERDVIPRSVVNLVRDVAKKLMRYICYYKKAPKIMMWKYCDPSYLIGAQSIVTGHTERGALLGLRRGRAFTQKVGEIHWVQLLVGRIGVV